MTPYGFGSQLTDPYRRLDASYEYYLHGPLARMELGDLGYKVQGTDYAYTLQGWLKGVNSTTLSPTRDMGGDGSGFHQTIGKDVYGYALHYYGASDYKAIDATVKPFADGTNLRPLFNGNIAGMSVNIPKAGAPQLYTYKYDQLNRLKDAQTHTGLNTSTNTWNATITQNFRETFSYDGNGNILTALRNGNATVGPQAMDNLTYGYNRDAGGKLLNNRLRHVKDAVIEANYADDLDTQVDDNYSYDAIGNLTKDTKAGISNISWTVYGKIKSITKTNGQNISYAYDPSGNRVAKTANGLSSFYVRDAQGNSLALYNNTGNTSNWVE